MNVKIKGTKEVIENSIQKLSILISYGRIKIEQLEIEEIEEPSKQIITNTSNDWESRHRKEYPHLYDYAGRPIPYC